MKILLIVFYLTTIKSILGVHGFASPQWLNSFRRKLYVPNQYQRVNPDLAKLIFLKQLLELDSIRNIYLRNCQIPHQFPKHQKLPLSTRLNAMSAVRNNGMHPPTGSGVQRKHFVSPKIIILPPWTSTEEAFGSNFQNHKELNYKKNMPQYSHLIPQDREKTEAADSKNEHSFRKENHGGDSYTNLENFKSSVTKNLTIEGNKKITFADGKIPELPMHPNPRHPPNVTYPTPDLLSHLKSSPTRIYEIEEIIEGTVKSENNFKKLSMGERPYFENNVESISRDKQEQKVLDNSIMKIIKEMTELVTNSPPTENLLSKVFVDASSEVPPVQSTTPIQYQHFFRVLPSDATKAVTKKTIFPIKTNLTAKKYPSHSVIHPHLLSIKKLDNEQETLKPFNKIHKIFDVTPSFTTGRLTHTIPDEGNTQKIESNGFETFPHTFFGFFNKESTENSGKKPETISEKMRLNPFTLPSIPPKLSDGIPQDLFKNLITNDLNLKMTNNEPPSSETKSFSQTSTDFDQTDNVTLIPFTHATNTKPNSTFKSSSQNPAAVETTTLGITQDKKDAPLTTSSSIVENSNSTTSKGPLSIDLLSSTAKPELKKDQEFSGKNSRKMNFNQNAQEETTFNRIIESSDSHPRRSDILIADYTDDYKDNENRFSNLSYLDKIKANDTILTDRNIDSYIPLLPEIINDIRSNKISDEDLSLLSKIFEKYWPNILELSNNKELDVLPLLTMKNEEDFVSFMESHFSNESKTSTVKTDDVKIDNKDSLKHAYDYDGAYEDLYDYVLGHELREKRKQYRHKRDDELEYQKLEANMEYFESLAEEQRIKKIEYMVEYAMYDESLEDDNISVLELIKPADLYVKQKNDTLQEEQN